jgi:hypothetical protein
MSLSPVAHNRRTPKLKQTLFSVVAVSVVATSTVNFNDNAIAYAKPSLSNILVSQASEPVVKWATNQPTERPLGVLTLQATITPAAHQVMKACLSSQDINGQNITSVKFPIDSNQYNLAECEYFGTGRSGWWVAGISAPKSMTISIDLNAGWPTRSRTLTLTATDAVGQEHKAAIAIPAVNHNRVLSPVGIGTNQFGWISFGLPNGDQVPKLGVYYKSICIKALNIDLCKRRIEGVGGAAGYFEQENISTNTACISNGDHNVTVIGTTIQDEMITENYVLSTANPKPKLKRVSISSSKPTWKDKTVSSKLNIVATNGCNYSVHLTGGAASRNYTAALAEDEASIDEGVATILFAKLRPRTKYTAKVTISSPQGKSIATKTFITPSIPPRSTGRGSGDANSGGGGTISFLGWNLARVRDIVGYAYTARQASSCSQYGMENGLFGIQDESNWIVVGQSGSTLFVCKK